ncbi:MAG TPA: tetratricopeptide repeat protein [Chthoniobacterales bacterium]|nr:tetratricopeptide repeat protein [Chthoniobacterales bacterium]
MVSTKQSRWQFIGVSVLLVAITWAVFGQTFRHQFINYDDPLYVLDNAHVRAGLTGRGIAWAFTHVHSQNWHPLTTISHMLDCQLFGVNPGAHHLVNVFLHSVAAVLLFMLLAQITAGPSSPRDESVRLADRTGGIWLSGFVAIVFAIHPLRVESVAWIAERKDVLSGVFFLLTLLAYVAYTRKQSVGRYLMMSILFACGLMSKPMLITTPVILLLLDYWPLKRGQRSDVTGQKKSAWGKLIVEKIPLFALSAGSFVATLWAQNFALGSTQFLPLQWRVTNAIFSYFEYIRQMFWPVDLIPFYVHPENRLEMWRFFLAAAILIALTVIAFVRRRQNPYLIVGWLWYLIMLVPVIGIVQVGLQGHADRYTYLPQIGLDIALTWLIWDLTKSCLSHRSDPVKAERAQKIVLNSAAALVLGTLSILSWKQTTHWRDTETLWRHTLTVTPDSDVAHAGLGGILFVRGQIDESIDHYEAALRLRDGNAAAHFGLGRALAAKQKTDAAIFHFQKALSIQPDYIGASNDLGVMFASKGEIKEAIAAWEQTLSFDPDNADAANNIAWVRATASDADVRDSKEALELVQRALRVGGENPVVLRTLAAAQAEAGQFEAAIRTCTRAEEIATKNGDLAMAENLRHCLELFRRGEPLHGTQVSH